MESFGMNMIVNLKSRMNNFRENLYSEQSNIRYSFFLQVDKKNIKTYLSISFKIEILCFCEIMFFFFSFLISRDLTSWEKETLKKLIYEFNITSFFLLLGFKRGMICSFRDKLVLFADKD